MVLITLLTPFLRVGSLCLKRSLLHSDELGEKVPQVPLKETRCFGEAFAKHRGRGMLRLAYSTQGKREVPCCTSAILENEGQTRKLSASSEVVQNLRVRARKEACTNCIASKLECRELNVALYSKQISHFADAEITDCRPLESVVEYF